MTEGEAWLSAATQMYGVRSTYYLKAIVLRSEPITPEVIAQVKLLVAEK